jgi:excisionase family DNA binding protein
VEEAEEMLLVSEAANQIRVAKSTIHRLIDAGELRALRVGLGKGAIRIPRRAWLEYLEACEEAARSTNRPADL